MKVVFLRGNKTPFYEKRQLKSMEHTANLPESFVLFFRYNKFCFLKSFCAELGRCRIAGTKKVFVYKRTDGLHYIKYIFVLKICSESRHNLI